MNGNIAIMKIKQNKIEQNKRLQEICHIKEVDYNSLKSLLDSVRTKKIKRFNYHQQKIADVIQKAVK